MRMRASGVRKSCEMPASRVVRFDSNSLTSRAIRLKLAASATSSRGPRSGSGEKPSAPRNACTDCAVSTNGPAMRRTMKNAAPNTMPAPMAPMATPT